MCVGVWVCICVCVCVYLCVFDCVFECVCDCMSVLASFGGGVGFVTVRVFCVNLYLCDYVGSCLYSVF